MIDQFKHEQVRIGLVSPEQISAWATKILPNGRIVGEVTNAFTFNYKTNKPVTGGLFCERIFGPIKSGICACGNSRGSRDQKEDHNFCEQCGVEFVDSRIRRYQMGYIKLACPVTHVWYLKRLPSYIANFLDQPLKDLEGLVYSDFSFGRPISKKPTFGRLRGLFEYEIPSWKYSIPRFFTRETFYKFQNRELARGASAIRALLADLDLLTTIDDSFDEWKALGKRRPTGKEWEDRKVARRKNFLIRRIQLAKHFSFNKIEPQWMVLCLLPVLPPELRPIIQIEGGIRMSPDINQLYKDVINRNIRLTHFFNLNIGRRRPSRFSSVQYLDSSTFNKRLLQEAVDTLLDNGIGGHPKRNKQNQVYKSFTDILEGKEGRFRETLLGKRVDYSGRSVIVVGPSLSLDQCGLPREIAIELFHTFLIRRLIRQQLASNIGVAKRQIRQTEPIVWKILEEVIQGHPVLLNRAPTLHRFGIQAFYPILVEGRAICLHPLVCKGFNADFDGDTMAVHVPLSLEAQAEARLLMFSHLNLLSPAMGDPICVPTQDMLMGLYVFTRGNRPGICANRYNPWNHKNYEKERIDDKNSKYRKEGPFCNSSDAVGAYRQKKIHFDSPLWLRFRGGLDQLRLPSKEAPIEVLYESFGTSHEIYRHYLIVRNLQKKRIFLYIRTTVGHLSFFREIEQAIQGLQAKQLYKDYDYVALRDRYLSSK
uniref:DNA-directed RNA polymerase subunit beta' n=1 Tax=Hypertelis spergulacea TaxID=764270 RepID=A0A411L8X4_9CARY|nr:RNA polymerase beta' subunit [Hypertelis spergulacea]